MNRSIFQKFRSFIPSALKNESSHNVLNAGANTVANSGLYAMDFHDRYVAPTTNAIIPMVIESTPRGERITDIFSRLLKERIVMLNGAVTEDLAQLVIAQLLYLESEDPEKPIYMYINSPGGLVTAGLAIYDTMQYINPKVSTICMGQACSMGSLLLTAGEPENRMSLPNAKIMLHQPHGGAQGQASDIEIQAREILRTRARLNNLYLFHTGQDLAAIEKVMDRDTFMDVEEALEFRVIDKIINKRITPAEQEMAA